jgi:5-methylcytosine-specific restriction protein A
VHQKRETHGRIQGRAGQKLRTRRLQRSNYLCEDCLPGRVVRATVVDHIKPLALGGEDIDGNTRNLCDPCHAKRTAEQFGHKHKQPIGLDGWPE